jgi:hypothetical protein
VARQACCPFDFTFGSGLLESPLFAVGRVIAKGHSRERTKN